MWWIDILDGGPGPKRGDLVQTNIGNRRERTWMVLRAKRKMRARRAHRYDVWAARWWELEPEMRMRLFLSAERNGGQRMFWMRRYPAKKKRRNFEELMAARTSA